MVVKYPNYRFETVPPCDQVQGTALTNQAGRKIGTKSTYVVRAVITFLTPTPADDRSDNATEHDGGK